MTEEELQQIIESYNNYIERMIIAVRHFCEDLEETDYQEISPALPTIFDGIGWLLEAGEGLMNLEQLPAEKYRSFQELIKDLGGAMENQDYRLLHDIFEFELLTLLTELKINLGKRQ